MTLKKMQTYIHKKLTKDYISILVEKFPKKIRLAKLKGEPQGNKLLNFTLLLRRFKITS